METTIGFRVLGLCLKVGIVEEDIEAVILYKSMLGVILHQPFM